MSDADSRDDGGREELTTAQVDRRDDGGSRDLLTAAQLDAYRRFVVAATVLFAAAGDDARLEAAVKLQVAAAEVALLAPEPVRAEVDELVWRSASPAVRYARLRQTQSDDAPAVAEAETAVAVAVNRTTSAIRAALGLAADQ